MKGFTSTIFLICIFSSYTIKTQHHNNVVNEVTYVCPPCNRKCDNLNFKEPGICQHCNMKLIRKDDLKKYPKSNRTKIGFYLQSGVEILDFAGPMEVFTYAGYEVFTISKNKDSIYAQGILTVTPDYDLSDAPEAEILVFFGGNAIIPSKDKELIQWIKSQKQTKYYFSVCSGAMILAEAGILDGYHATTFRNNLDVLENNFPEVKVLRDVRYVDNGKVITTAGVSAGIDGALHMVAKLEGLSVAGEIAFYIEYDKWIPNQGIVLTKDNPYHQMNDSTILDEYVGEFTSNTGNTISLKLDSLKNGLSLEIDNDSHPIFYLEKDKFLTSHISHLLMFKRDTTDRIIRLESTQYKELFDKK